MFCKPAHVSQDDPDREKRLRSALIKREQLLLLCMEKG